MPSDPESESLSSFSVVTKGRRPPRAHPRLTVYRILFFSLTAGFGTIKAIYSYQGQTMAPTTFDWVYSIVVVSALFWLGLYDEECPDKMPRWMFETDVVDSVVKMVNQLREQCHNMNLRMLLRKVVGYSAEPKDPEQRIESGDMPLTQLEGTVESNGQSTGVQFITPSVGLTHRSGGGYGRTWTNPTHHREEFVECNYCDRTFVSDAALHDHCVMKADHPYCESCEIIFGDENALQQHIRDAAVHQVRGHTVPRRQKDARAYCKTCNMYFGDENALQQHIQDASVHHFCEQCNRQFDDRDAICRHLAASSHHDWCFACWDDLGSQEKLKKHCASVHTGKRTKTECPLCDQEFGNPINIGPHIKRGCA